MAWCPWANLGDKGIGSWQAMPNERIPLGIFWGPLLLMLTTVVRCPRNNTVYECAAENVQLLHGPWQVICHMKGTWIGMAWH